MKKTRRTSRVGENVRDALSEVLRRDISDVRIGWSSISEVEVSPDLHYAKVYMTGLKEEDTKADVEMLRKLAPKIRHFLGKRLKLKYTPELDFRYDASIAHAARIDSLLEQIRTGDAEPDGDREK